MTEQGGLSTEARRVSRAAILMSIGNVASRALGLVREMTKSYYFGAGGAVSAFDVATQVPTMLHDQLVGGMLSSSLVPVFSGYARSEDREELWRVFSQVFTIISLLLAVLVVFLELAAPWVARVLGRGLAPEYRDLATSMIRITSPAVFLLNIAGLFSAILYAMQRFRLPAFTSAVYNATMVAVIILYGRSALGTKSLAVGLLVATLAQAAFQIPGLRGMRTQGKGASVPAQGVVPVASSAATDGTALPAHWGWPSGRPSCRRAQFQPRLADRSQRHRVDEIRRYLDPVPVGIGRHCRFGRYFADTRAMPPMRTRRHFVPPGTGAAARAHSGSAGCGRTPRDG